MSLSGDSFTPSNHLQKGTRNEVSMELIFFFQNTRVIPLKGLYLSSVQHHREVFLSVVLSAHLNSLEK